MRTIPSDLSAHLADGATILCHCWKLIRRDGMTFGFTDRDRDLAFGGIAYAARTGLEAAEATAELGFAVGGGEVSGALVSAGLTEDDISSGLYDDASVETWLVNWSAVDERVLLDVGSIGEIRRADGSFVAEVRGLMHRFDEERGRAAPPASPQEGDRYLVGPNAAGDFAGQEGAIALFDLAVHSGPSEAVRMLQVVLGVPADGLIGPVTLDAARGADPANTIRRLTRARLGFLARLGVWPVFGRGWRRRVLAVEQEALRRASTHQPTQGASHMFDTKSILASRTIWANLIGLVALVLGLFGFDSSAMSTGAFQEALVQLIAAGSFVASTVFRILATKQIVN